MKPKTRDEQGQQKKIESPIHHSNVMLYSTAKGVRSRVAYKVGCPSPLAAAPPPPLPPPPLPRPAACCAPLQLYAAMPRACCAAVCAA